MRGRRKLLIFLLIGSPLVLVFVYGLCLVSFRAEPTGLVASYSVYAHAMNDTLKFADGKVTLQTCCGDESWGTYVQGADGAWIWHMTPPSKGRVAGDIRLQPGWFAMRFTGVTDPTVDFTLRRRVFRRVPL